MPEQLERFEPTMRGRMAYEHLHRYAICRDLATDRDVLDLACGEGYGAWTLSATARSVVAFDIDAETVAQAAARYRGRDNLTFRKGDARAIDAPDESFDVVVAFEFIEHIAEHDAFLAEARRVLRPDGFLVLSTPERNVYNRYKAPNTFHVRELDLPEFHAALSAHFADVAIYGQRLAIVSAVAPETGTFQGNAPFYKGYTVERADSGRLEPLAGVEALSSPEYLIAICGRSGPPPKLAEPSMFLDADNDLFDEHERVLAWASTVHDENEGLKQRIRDFEAEKRALTGADYVPREAVETARRTGFEEGAQRASARTLSTLLGRTLGRDVGHDDQAIVAAATEALVASASRKSRLEALERELADKARDLELAHRSAAAAAEDRDRAEAARGDLVEANHALRLKVAGLETALEQSQAARRAAQEAETHRAVEAAELRKALANQDDAEEAARLRAALMEREAALSAATVQRDQAQAMASDRAAEAARLRAEVETSGRDLAVATRERDAAQREAADRLAEAERLAGETELMRQDLDATRRDAAAAHAAEAKQAGEATRLGAELNAARRSVDALRAERDEAQRVLDAERVAGATTEILRESVRRAGSTVLQNLASAIRESRTGAARLRRRAQTVDRIHLEALEALAAGLPNAAAHLLPDPPAPPRGRMLGSGRPWNAVAHADARNAARDWRAAAAGYAAALRLDPSRAPLWVQFAHMLKEMGEPIFAEAAYRRALAIAPDDPDTRLHLGHLLLARGREMAAREQFEAVRQADPSAETPEIVDSPVTLDDIFAPLTRITPLFARVLSETLTVPDGAAPVTADPYAAASRSAAGAVDPTARETPPPTPGTPVIDIEAAVATAVVPVTPMAPALEEHVAERYGEDVAPNYRALQSVIAAYEDDVDAFAGGPDQMALLARAQRLSAARSGPAPEASVVIPAHNNLLYTITCVVALLEHGGDTPFEVLIGDDASTDGTKDVLGAVGGVVRVVRSEEAQGFILNCNRTAAEASGRFVALLNNDTLALPHWLDNLLEPLRRDPRIGMTGSKLLNGDGTLQEAGGILWRDGSAWNFGRNENPRAPEFEYAREVDYISGASIALRRTDWETLGGFDTHYLPAYCEDADLAFRVRKAGMTVWYAPRSEVVHHEGRSHGRDESTGIKAYQVANGRKLRERWRTQLEAEHFENGENVLLARDRSARKPHILFIDHYVPEVDRDAGSRTMFCFVKLFVDAGFQVSFWPENLYRAPGYSERLMDMGVEVIFGPRYVDALQEFLEQRAPVLDYVFMSRPTVTEKIIDQVEAVEGVTRLYYGHDLHFRQLEQRIAEGGSGSQAEVDRMRNLELDLCRRVDLALYPSQDEADFVLEAAPDVTCAAISMAVYEEAELAQGVRKIAALAGETTRDLLFVGGFNHPPNLEGLLWFVEEVLPLLRARDAGLRLNIVGSKTPERVRTLAGSDIVVHGHVSDAALAEIYAGVGVVIAPLLHGAGVKGKVIEAMARGVPVVMTSIGAQGIPDAGKLGRVADSPEAFAEAVIRALDDRDESRARAERAIAFIRDRYSTATVRRTLAPHVPQLAATEPARSVA
jgi:GT2 family glycosyltransferase/ubiquinone/menaquinone biosynthesis C-methylase UbiE